MQLIWPTENNLRMKQNCSCTLWQPTNLVLWLMVARAYVQICLKLQSKQKKKKRTRERERNERLTKASSVLENSHV